MGSKKIQAVLEWALALVLIFFVVKDSSYLNYYHLSPIKAHEQSERTFYYGPSEIIEEFDFGDIRIYLAKYKDWFSANTVTKYAGVFWQPGSHVNGFKIEEEEDISYTWSSSKINEELMLMKYYGIVTNPKIDKVELDVTVGYVWDEEVPEDDIETLSESLDDHRMFLFHWNENEDNYLALALRGLDEKGNIIYEENLR
ncbi:DUF5044 domain-containing protein [Ornithinibacillus sp. L9]|uniref:DUF5044 domain-containing protein n=1 Tax=Ornithinibacillus caprae TaxID=2678566 RepID=A0A6N8FKR4_9BACI|nr:DUF5044 domain-containing protein [Ornithinibacillus caprae]MUK88577.1 DUF5044 domain-containing protein [Ornithinibacillus caprae]